LSESADRADPLERPPGALRSLGEAVVLSHANFLRLYPLALLVDGTLEAIAMATGTTSPGLRFGELPSRLAALHPGRSSLLEFASILLVVGGAFVPMLATTAVAARAVVERMRGRPARPLQSLAAGARRLPLAVATALAFAILPVATLWLPSLFDDSFRMIPFFFFAAFAAVVMDGAIIGRWIFALPAAVLERRGAISALRRSERLGEGRAVRTLGLVLLGGLIGGALFWFEVRGAHALLPGVPADSDRPASAPLAVAVGIGRTALDAWFHVVVATVTIVYFERVRLAKEGLDAEELRSVFH